MNNVREYEYIEKFKFYTMTEILNRIDSMYPKKWFMMNTGLKTCEDRFTPYKRDFQERLMKKDLGYFAYIKFFIADDKRIYGLVSGKTGTYHANKSSGADVSFSMKQDAKSRKFIMQNNFEWYKEEILIVRPKIEYSDDNHKKNNNEALAIERCLKKEFNLF